MGNPISSRTRLQIRQSIGRNIGAVIIGTVTSTEDTSSLVDTYGLATGGDDEYKGRQVQINTPSGSIVAGEKSFVAEFDSALSDATMAPVFTANLTVGDIYEMWKLYTIEEINNLITQAEIEVTDDALLDTEDHTTTTESKRYIYAMPSGFVAIHKVEYVYSVQVEKVIHNCDTVWDELVDGDVTATLDESFKQEGTGCLKLVVAAGAGAGDILATQDIPSLDLSGTNELEIWIYSTTALDAGDLQVLLDDTALCASPVESLDIPATAASTWTRHVITLANPQNDSAIISVGLKMVTDKGAFTLYTDDIRGVDGNSRQWKLLNPDYWNIVRGSTNYFQLTTDGLQVCGVNKLLRLTGYKKLTVMSADTGTCEVDPDFIVSRVTSQLLSAHVKSVEIDMDDRKDMSDRWHVKAETKKLDMRTRFIAGTRWT